MTTCIFRAEMAIEQVYVHVYIQLAPTPAITRGRQAALQSNLHFVAEKGLDGKRR